MNARATIVAVLGALMLGFGAYIVGRMLVTGGAALSGKRWLDGMFALFFILRGLMNLSAARKLRRTGT